MASTSTSALSPSLTKIVIRIRNLNVNNTSVTVRRRYNGYDKQTLLDPLLGVHPVGAPDAEPLHAGCQHRRYLDGPGLCYHLPSLLQVCCIAYGCIATMSRRETEESYLLKYQDNIKSRRNKNFYRSEGFKVM